MNEKAKNFLHRSWHEPALFFMWLAAFSLAFSLIALLLIDLKRGPVSGIVAWPVFIVILVFLFALPACVLSCIPPLRGIFRWVLRRRWQIFAGLITFIALVVSVENWRGRRAWQNFKAEAAKQGEKLEVADIIPPPVPDEQNFAAAPIFQPLLKEFEWPADRARTGIPPNHDNQFKFNIWPENVFIPDEVMGSWVEGRRTDWAKLQEYYRQAAGTNAPSANVEAPAAGVLLAFSKYDAVLDQLRAAAARPYSRFPIHYQDGFSALLPHLANTKGCAQVLALQADAELALGQSDKALADVLLACRIMDLAKDEPLLISQLVRLAMAPIIIRPIWVGLIDHRWSDAQLAALEAELAKIDFLADYHVAMRGERAFSVWTMDFLRRERDLEPIVPAGKEDARGNQMESALGAVFFRILPGGWFDQNKVSLARLHRDYTLPAVDLKAHLASPATSKAMTQKMLAGFGRIRPYDCFGSLLLPAFENASERVAWGQTCVDLARIACAIERQRLATGEIPQTLESLAPKFIARLPHDVINGQPLKYRREENGTFVLYSVGWNEKDDGGQIVRNQAGGRDSKQGDWVWRSTLK